MNVIVANKQKQIIDNANIDAIKDFNGLFNVDDLVSKFKNYFFSKLILDATSIVNFTTREVLEKLSNSIGAERLIILLPEKPTPPKSFVDMLLEFKIYNFSNKIEDIVSYIEKPNTYEDIIKKMEYDNSFYVDNSIKASDDYREESTDINNEKQVLANNSIEEKNNISNEVNNNEVNNFNNQVEDRGFYVDDKRLLNKKIIGFRNVTSHAGTTTIIFLLKKMAKQKFNKRVLAIEVDSDDMKYYQEDEMISVGKDNLKNTIAASNAEVVFVDLNNYKGEIDYFSDVIYLVEPSIIKLNKIMINDRFTFRALEGKKIILNQSFLSNNDANAFSKEAGVDIFMNIPPLNDRMSNDFILKLLNNLLKQ